MPPADHPAARADVARPEPRNQRPGSSPESQARRAKNRAREQARGGKKRCRARPCYPGASFKSTRRCADGLFLFVPDDLADTLINLIGYVYGVACMKYGVSMHAAVVLSQHKHEDLTDNPLVANAPRFDQFVNSMLARGVNALRGRMHASVWDTQGPCRTLRPPGEKGLRDLAYTLANPTSAGLVKTGGRWPGFTTYGWKFGEPHIFHKPEVFFDSENGNLPDEVELTMVKPPELAHMTDEEATSEVMKWVRAEEKKAQLERRGKRFLGEEKVRRQSWRRTDPRPRDAFKVKPKVAASNTWARIRQLQHDRQWEELHRQAAADHADPDIPPEERRPYPAGTFMAVRVHGANVEPLPADLSQHIERLATAGYPDDDAQPRPPP